jgi:sensor histidine kinase YesM
MHPLLASRRRLLLYLAAWAPVVALLVQAGVRSGARPLEAAAVFTPACLLFAFVCLSPWQICRAMPLTPASSVRLLGIFLAAGIAGSSLLVAASIAVAYNLAPLLFLIGVLLYLLSAGLHYALLAAEASVQAEKRAAEARALAREAELHSLRIQLNPHFLFNSLHSISALATIDGARARDMCLRLGEFLRCSLGLGDRELIPLRDELALARSYLEVERVRFGDRLRVEEIVYPECEDCGVPPLVLQPLVENAVKHGVSGLLEGATIRLVARRSETGVQIVVENAFDPEATAAQKTGRGVDNVRRRLAARYGSAASFEAGPAGELYRVELRLPCESPIASSKRA